MAKIKSIKKKEYKGKVHDLTVKDVHAYNIEGLSVHNSAVGSLALYILGITKIDPLKYDLLFERFLNPERVSPPDVDVDFDYYRRQEIYDYIYRKYGQDHCCKIGTYNSLQSKAVVRRCAKALDIGNDWDIHQNAKLRNPDQKIEMTKNNLQLADFISKTIPVSQAVDTSIEAQLKDNPNFRNAVSKYPRLLSSVRKLEGTLSSSGVHPAGVVICKDRIDKYIPLRDSKDQICSQFDGPEVEELGLLKFDLLALKTLTVVNDSLQYIKNRHNKVIDIDELEPNDTRVFDLLNGKIPSLDNRGVFQFESEGISTLLKSIKVDSFEDMIVANALYRPGPLKANMHTMYADYKHGRKPINPLHPKMKELLKDTYSIMVYQENVMKIAQELAGFSKGQSDFLRKAVGKKDMKLLEKMKAQFIDGCEKNDISRNIASRIFEQIEFFGGYGFNKSHSCAYAFLAYQCCYLKVYYPIEFMTSLMSSEIDNSDKNLRLRTYIAQSQAMNITVGKTNINYSGTKFRIERKKDLKTNREYDFIRQPLTMLDGVGLKAAESIVENQPFSGLEDFLRRVDTSKVSSKIYTALVNAGSMDSWRASNVKVGEHRAKLLTCYDGVKKKVIKEKNEIKKQTTYRNQFDGSIFDSFGSISF